MVIDGHLFDIEDVVDGNEVIFAIRTNNDVATIYGMLGPSLLLSRRPMARESFGIVQ